MSWWPFSSPSPPTPNRTADGAFEAPDRTSRTKCWAARDDFFACLDRAGIVDSIKEAPAASKACGVEEKDLRRECAESWVTYFKQRRVMEVKKAAMLKELEQEGAQELPEGTQLPQGVVAGKGGGGAGAGGSARPKGKWE